MARVVLPRRTAPEPAARMPLVWGDYPGRYLAGLVLLIGGAALVVQTSALTLGLGLLGSVLHAAGWAVQPGRVAVRAAIAVPAVLVCWCTITGPKAMWVLAFLLAFWLLLRRRPPRTYWTPALPLGLGLLIAALPPEVTDKTAAFWSVSAMVGAGAWIARELALKVRPAHTNRIASVPTEGADTP